MNPSEYTPEMRNVFDAAIVEAERLRHDYVGTEHLLLGMISTPHSSARKILESFTPHVESLAEVVDSKVRKGRAMGNREPLPYTSRVQKSLLIAAELARSEQKDVTGSEHLLLAFADDERGIAGEVLLERGITVESIADVLLRMRPSSHLHLDTVRRSRERVNNLLASYAERTSMPEQVIASGRKRRVRISAEIPEWVDSEDVPQLLAQIAREVSRLNIAAGGEGLIVEGVELGAGSEAEVG
jgi:ATP-dependent Clp protease ATP-binding subunit ClpA